MKITKYLNFQQEHKDLIIRVKDIIENELSLNSFKILYFVDPAQTLIVQDVCHHYENINCFFISKFSDPERRLCVLAQGTTTIETAAMTTLFSFHFRSKFNKLRHQDVLGALLNLKIARKHLGDIYINADNAYFEVNKTIEDYVSASLERINTVPVKLVKCCATIKNEKKFLAFDAVVNSLRLDNIIKAITGLSSSKTRALILNSFVKVNYVTKTNHTLLLREGAVLSIRGYGRFQLESYHVTKKDKYRLKYVKFIG